MNKVRQPIFSTRVRYTILIGFVVCFCMLMDSIHTSLTLYEGQDQYDSHHLANAVTTPEDVDRISQYVFTIIDEYDVLTKMDQYFDVINNLRASGIEPSGIEPFHGCTVQTHLAASSRNPFTAVDYERMRSWGMTTVLFHTWWGQVEPNERQPGVYDEAYLNRIRQQVDLAKSHGLYVFIAIRATYGLPVAGRWRGWPNNYSFDYVNLNQRDAAGTRGRDRLIDLWRRIATDFPDVGLCLTFFPYHREGAAAGSTRSRTLHQTTIPALYQAVRPLTDQWIIIHPLHQGNHGGKTTGTYSFVDREGWPFVDDPKLLYGFNNHGTNYNNNVVHGRSWDPSTIATLQSHYQPLLDFMAKYNIEHAIVCEGTPLQVHKVDPKTRINGRVRPIDSTRLAWLAAHLQYMNQNGLHWLYYVYQRGPTTFSPIDRDGSDNGVATILASYTRTLHPN